MFERCLYFNTNALARRVNRVWNEAYGQLGLAPSHAYLLRLILTKPGLSQKEIARELRLEKSTITRFIDKLQDEGYLQRRSHDPADGRAQNIFPTKKAKAIGDQLEDTGEQLYRSMLEQLGKDHLALLVDLLRKAEQTIT